MRNRVPSTLISNLIGPPRREWENGREFLVVPAVLINPGVLPGSRGPLAYTPQDTKAATYDWNGVPLTARHPHDPITNDHLSASSPGVWDRQGIGNIREAEFDGRLRSEAWVDVAKANQVDRRIVPTLSSGQSVECSTGLFTDNDPAPAGSSMNGRPFMAYARNHRPDHVAVLLDERGACSLQDGCGLLVNAWHPTTNANPEGHNQYSALRASKDAHEASKELQSLGGTSFSYFQKEASERSSEALRAARKGDVEGAYEGHVAAIKAHEVIRDRLDLGKQRRAGGLPPKKAFEERVIQESNDAALAAHKNALDAHGERLNRRDNVLDERHPDQDDYRVNSVSFKNDDCDSGGWGGRKAPGSGVRNHEGGECRCNGTCDKCKEEAEENVVGYANDSRNALEYVENPMKSEAQRRWMHANEPEMAERWEKHTPKGKKLPERVSNANPEGHNQHSHGASGGRYEDWLGAVNEILRHTKGKTHESFPNRDPKQLHAEGASPKQAALALVSSSKMLKEPPKVVDLSKSTSNEANFASESQRKFMWSQHPDVAEAWAHGEHTAEDEHHMPPSPGSDVKGPQAKAARKRRRKREATTNFLNRLDQLFVANCGGKGSGRPGPCPKDPSKAHLVARAHAAAAAHALASAATKHSRTGTKKTEDALKAAHDTYVGKLQASLRADADKNKGNAHLRPEGRSMRSSKSSKPTGTMARLSKPSKTSKESPAPATSSPSFESKAAATDKVHDDFVGKVVGQHLADHGWQDSKGTEVYRPMLDRAKSGKPLPGDSALAKHIHSDVREKLRDPDSQTKDWLAHKLPMMADAHAATAEGRGITTPEHFVKYVNRRTHNQREDVMQVNAGARLSVWNRLGRMLGIVGNGPPVRPTVQAPAHAPDSGRFASQQGGRSPQPAPTAPGGTSPGPEATSGGPPTPPNVSRDPEDYDPHADAATAAGMSVKEYKTHLAKGGKPADTTKNSQAKRCPECNRLMTNGISCENCGYSTNSMEGRLPDKDSPLTPDVPSGSDTRTPPPSPPPTSPTKISDTPQAKIPNTPPATIPQQTGGKIVNAKHCPVCGGDVSEGECEDCGWKDPDFVGNAKHDLRHGDTGQFRKIGSGYGKGPIHAAAVSGATHHVESDDDDDDAGSELRGSQSSTDRRNLTHTDRLSDSTDAEDRPPPDGMAGADDALDYDYDDGSVEALEEDDEDMQAGGEGGSKKHVKAKSQGKNMNSVMNAWSDAARAAALAARKGASKIDFSLGGKEPKSNANKLSDKANSLSDSAFKSSGGKNAKAHDDAADAHYKAAQEQFRAGNVTKAGLGAENDHHTAGVAHMRAGDEHKRASFMIHEGLTHNQSESYMDPHQASKDAAKASLDTEHEKSFGHAKNAVMASGDDECEDAAKHHVKAAASHERAATKARMGDEDNGSAESHDNAAAMHRRAASMHAASLTDNTKQLIQNWCKQHGGTTLNSGDNMTRQELVDNDWGAAYQAAISAGHPHDQAAAMASKAEPEGSKAGQASAKAGTASKRAAKTGKSADHRAAAKAHRSAANYHGSAGDTEKASFHKGKATDHAAKAMKATSANNQFHDFGGIMDREQALAVLTANIDGEADLATLNQLSDKTLISMARNAEPDDDDDDDDDENLEDNDQDQHSFDFAKQPASPAMQAGGKGMKDEYMKNNQAMNRWLSAMPPQARGVWNRVMEADKQQRLQVVRQLVGNVANPQLRNQIGNDLMRLPPEQFQREVNRIQAIVGPVQNAYGRELSEPSYLGATDLRLITNEEVNNADQDTLDAPTMNQEDWMESASPGLVEKLKAAR